MRLQTYQLRTKPRQEQRVCPGSGPHLFLNIKTHRELPHHERPPANGHADRHSSASLYKVQTCARLCLVSLTSFWNLNSLVETYIFRSNLRQYAEPHLHLQCLARSSLSSFVSTLLSSYSTPFAFFGHAFIHHSGCHLGFDRHQLPHYD